jgi:Zn ribbon nucleic-acid-binding protein
MHVENIKVGDWLVVVGNKALDAFEQHPNDEVFGGPIRVRAINAPYLAISDARNPKLVKTIDTRFWHLSRADEDYVKTFQESEAAGAFAEPSEQPSVTQEQVVEVFRCPVCREGKFLQVWSKNQCPVWRCTECKREIAENVDCE